MTHVVSGVLCDVTMSRYTGFRVVVCMVGLLCAASVAHGLVVGIDVGEEYLKVALVKPGRPFEIVHNSNSRRKTQNVAAFYQGQRLFAGDAMNLATRKPHLVFHNVLGMLGRNMTHPNVQQVLKNKLPAFEVLEAEGGRGTLAVRAGLGRGDSPDKERALYTVEEVMAMVLTYVRGCASDTAGAQVRHAVITVPMYFTQTERLAIIDAAELAGLKVLALVEENTAAAIQYGIDRVYENKTYTLIFNMGAAGTQATVLASTSYKGRDRGQKKQIGLATAVGKGWDMHLGAGAFTDRLVQHLADIANAEYMKDGQDVRNIVRAMAKLRKGAQKTKEVLSANDNFVLFIESLTPDIDFRTVVQRATMEEISADLLDRVTPVIARALEAAKISVEDLDEVEIIGGGVRIPAVQTRLREFLGDLPLGVHLNGDEAMALGASFLAANRSKAFHVRKVGMVDTYPFAIGVRLAELPGAEVPVEVDDEGNPKKPWHKRSQLFRKYNHLQSIKKITFPHTRDFQLKLQYENSDLLPVGTPKLLVVANVTGVAEAAAQVAHLGVPKVSMSFKLDHNGIAHVTRAEASIEEIIPPEPEPEVEGEDEGEAATEGDEGEGSGNGSDDGEGGRKLEENETDDENDDENDDGEHNDEGSEDGEGSDTGAGSGTGDDDGDNTGDKKGDKKDEKKEDKKEVKSKKAKKPTKKVHRFPLTISRDVDALAIRPFGGELRDAAIARLAALDAVDEERRKREEAKNGLESYVYATRDRLEENEEGIAKVTIPVQVDQVNSDLSDTTEWLYDEGEDATFKEYKDRRRALEDLVDPIFFRLEEAAVRDEVVADAAQALSSVADIMKQWEVEKPQVNETERVKALDMADKAKKWLDEQVAQQAEQLPHLPPLFTKASVRAHLKPIQDYMRKLARRPALPEKKPEPEPEPEGEGKAEGEGSDDGGDGGDSTQQAGEEATEQQQEQEQEQAAQEGGDNNTGDDSDKPQSTQQEEGGDDTDGGASEGQEAEL